MTSRPHLASPFVVLRRAYSALRSVRWTTFALLTTTVAYGSLEYVYFERDPIEAAYAAAQAIQWNLETAPDWTGPTWAIALGWLLRFLVPLTFAGLVFDALAKLGWVRPLLLLQDHAVIIGAGNLGTALALELRARGIGVVVIERSEEARTLEDLRNADVRVILGDGASAAVLADAHVAEAAYLVAVTASDLANVEAALTALRVAAHPRSRPNGAALRCLAHVSDSRFRASLDQMLDGALGTLDSYTHAAEQLHALRRAQWSQVDTLVIAGFGKFGKAVFRVFSAGEGPKHIRVLDRNNSADARAEFERVRDQANRTEATASFEVMNFEDDAAIDAMCKMPGATPAEQGKPRVAIAICTDQDVRNFDLAWRIHARYGPDDIFVSARSFDEPAAAFRERLGPGTVAPISKLVLNHVLLQMGLTPSPRHPA